MKLEESILKKLLEPSKLTSTNKHCEDCIHYCVELWNCKFPVGFCSFLNQRCPEDPKLCENYGAHKQIVEESVGVQSREVIRPS